MIDRFDGEFRFLSNFYPCILPGLTVEHFYQAAKTHIEGEKRAIMECATPGQAKRRGQHVTLRPDWEDVKVHIMLNWLRVKFEPGSRLAEKLLDTGDQELIEGNTWHDRFWGKCQCSKHMGEGRNMLGELLMLVREELRQ